ncbi:MAG: Arc family DNA-binding protein [Fimbriimonadaceae bacterium]
MAEKKSFVLRISPELWEALQSVANEEFRSVNGQIEWILTEYTKKRRNLKNENERTE